MKGEVFMSERIRTGLIIIGVYILFILYLFFVSYRVDTLDKNTYNDNKSVSIIKLNNN